MATLLVRIDELAPGDAEEIEAVLRAMPGVYGVVVSPAEGCAEVDLEDDEVDLVILMTRLREAGYRAYVAG